MIALVDMGLSNLGSVALALARVGAAATVTGDPGQIARADAVILPGVGAFGDGMAALGAKGLIGPLRRYAREGRPMLGICLGMQLMAEAGEEHGHHAGLGLLPGRVVSLPKNLPGCRVPNMGWCEVSIAAVAGPLAALRADPCFYFAHSFHFVCADAADRVAALDFGGMAVSAAVQRERLLGLQFHPEKSQDAGLEVLAAWVADLGAEARG